MTGGWINTPRGARDGPQHSFKTLTLGKEHMPSRRGGAAGVCTHCVGRTRERERASRRVGAHRASNRPRNLRRRGNLASTSLALAALPIEPSGLGKDRETSNEAIAVGEELGAAGLGGSGPGRSEGGES